MSKVMSLAVTAVLLSAISISDNAKAALITKVISYSNSQITGDLTFDFTGFNYDILGDARLKFWVTGDLGDGRYSSYYCGSRCGFQTRYSDSGGIGEAINNVREFIDVAADGYSFGRWLDNKDSNDTIGGNDFGYGSHRRLTQYGYASIAQNTFEQMVADDMFSVSYDYSSAVNHSFSFSSARVELTFEGELSSTRNNNNPVPAPSSIMLLLAGIAALGSRIITKKP